MSEENKQPEGILVCGLAQACAVIIPGTTFAINCSGCNRRVAISPSGQARLEQEKPRLRIVCTECFEMPDGAVDFQFTSGSVEGMLEEFSKSIPNPLKNNN